MLRSVIVSHRLASLTCLLVLLAAPAACKSTDSSGANPSAKSPSEAKAPPVEAGSVPATAPPADPREETLARTVADLLASQHVRKRPIDDALSRAAFAEYLERLDAGKMFLLRENVATLEASAELMDDQLREGDLVLAREATAMLAKRRSVVGRLVSEILAEPLDLSDEETIETDAEKRDFAADDRELRERWRKALELQVLERVARMEEVAEALAKGEEAPDAGVTDRLGDIPDTFEGREKKAREDLAKSFAGRFSRLERIQPLEPAEIFLNAVATVYDPHTAYLAPADKANFDIQMSGSLEGIGAVLSEDDHYIVVREIVPGGASWRHGKLEAGDLILAVAQAEGEPVDVADMRIDEVVKMIRGPKGTVVHLTIKKPDGRVEVISITRDVVEIEAAYARGAVLDLGPKHPPVGYVYLPSFYGGSGGSGERNAAADVKALLGALSKKKLAGVILDLRGNGGGFLDQARDITGYFIEKGPVVQTRYSSGESQVLADEDESVVYGGEVVVLVDRFSASASEIVAGALQDYRRAVVVGTGPTHGKGTVQMLIDLDRLAPTTGGDPLGVLKLTIQQYFRVDGDSTQWRGVVPDIVLPDPIAHVEAGERFYEHSIPWSEIDALKYKAWKKSKWDVDTLVAKSTKRRTRHPIFAKIDARASFLAARADDTIVPLERGAWLARRERDEQALEAVDPKLSDGPARFTVEELDYNGKKSNASDPRTVKALERWRNELARDPWVEESLRILGDMR